MRIIFGLCVAALLAVVACASTTAANTCEAAGGACHDGTVGCGETLPYDCDAPNLSCCRPGSK